MSDIQGTPELTVPQIPAAEFASRRERAVEAARARGLDGLLIWSRGGPAMEHNGDVLYLTNYTTPLIQMPRTTMWSGRGNSILVLPVDDEPTLILEMPDAPLDLVYVSDVRFGVHLPLTVADVLKEKGLDKRKLGLVGRETLLLDNYRLLIDAVGHDLDFESAEDILERLRMVKSDAEVAVMRHAGRVGARWMRMMMEAAEEGKTEADIVGAGLRFLAMQGGAAYEVGVGSGPDSLKWHGQRNGLPMWEASRPLESGDFFHVDATGSVANYYTDLARATVVGGPPTDGQREALEAARGIVKHIVDGVKPGVVLDELFHRGASWLIDNGFGPDAAAGEDAGVAFTEAVPMFGHGLGLNVEFPWIIEGEMTVLEENMVLAVEFFHVDEGVGGTRFESNVLVTSAGYEILDAECPEKWWD
jgi:Xaa-Pro aminopeptidase